MQTVNLLKFLNSVQTLKALEFSVCDRELFDLLDFLVKNDEQFVQQMNLGILYVNQYSMGNYVVVDGINRIVSLSLLLHAICECYKKTTAQNDKAIKTIRSKYIVKKEKYKLRLSSKDDELYKKIINGERLSGREKSKPLFALLHKFWTYIKENKLQASNIFKILQKVQVMIVETDDVGRREVYIETNKIHRTLNQIVLIDDYIKDLGQIETWKSIKSKYFLNKDDVNLFLKDFLITKFNYANFDESCLYSYFKNYCDFMMTYKSAENILKDIKQSCILYYNILNINFENNDIKKMFINIKKHSGEDTYAYLLNVYEDFYKGSISESIFIEILSTIDEYLKNRLNSGKNIDFNELVNYLNAFITCK